MSRVYLVRHGKSAAGFSEATDSDLSELGLKQAKDAAQRLNDLISPIQIIASPFLRAKRSAEPLAQLWGCSVEIAHQITEIPCPYDDHQGDLPKRRPWLDTILKQKFRELGSDIQGWHQEVIQYIKLPKRLHHLYPLFNDQRDGWIY